MHDERPPGSAGSGGKTFRERTLLGTGSSANRKDSPLGVPMRGPTAAREKTVLGIAPQGGMVRPAMAPPAMKVPAREWSQQEPPPEDWDLPHPAPREPSVLVDLSELAPAVRIPVLAVPSVPRVVPFSDESEPSLVPAGVPRRRRLVWLLLLLVVAGAVAFGCVRRDALQPLARTWALRLVQSRPVAAVRAFVSHPRGGSDAPH